MDPFALLLGVLSIVAAGMYFSAGLGSVILQPIDVPSRLEQNGYTSSSFTRLVLDEIDSIYFVAGADYTGATVHASSGGTVSIAGANLSLAEVKAAVGKTIGSIKFEFTGAVIDRDGKLVLKLTGHGTDGVHRFITESAAPDNPYALVRDAARDVVHIIDPYVATRYQFEIDKATGDFTKSLAMIPEVLPRLDREQYHFLYDLQGRAFHLSNQPDKAIEAFGKSIQLDPGYPLAYANLAFTLRQLGRGGEADALDRKALTLDPKFFGYFRYWGDAYRRAGLDERCVYNFSRFLDYVHDDARAYYDIGTCYRRLGRGADGDAAFSRAASLDPAYSVPAATKP